MPNVARPNPPLPPAHPRLSTTPLPTNPLPRRLKNRELPCVTVGNGKVVLPAEVCHIVAGQVRCPPCPRGLPQHWLG